MSELLARLQADLRAARKAQDRAGTLLLGTTLAELNNRRIELRQDLTDDDVREVLRKAVKRRREAAELYEQGNRTDLAQNERAEIAGLEKYLPAAVSEDELRAAVQSAIAGGASNLGAVMGRVMPRFKGQADGATINAIAREELSKKS